MTVSPTARWSAMTWFLPPLNSTPTDRSPAAAAPLQAKDRRLPPPDQVGQLFERREAVTDSRRPALRATTARGVLRRRSWVEPAVCEPKQFGGALQFKKVGAHKKEEKSVAH